MTGARALRAGPLWFALLLGITACSSNPPRSETKVSRPGGYYLDDGPIAMEADQLERVPDAVPREEPIKPSTTRPYSVFGQTYAPMSMLGPYKATGMASWYGRRYHGQATASGEIYDMFAMSAAHPTLPIPSYVRVRHLDNGRSVIVRVNDRGPFHSERLIDLSYTAAYKLGMLDRGRGLVEVESLLPPFDAAIDKPIVDAKAGGSDLPPNTVARPSAAATAPRGIYLQLGAFSLLKNAQAFVARLESELDWLASKTSVRREGRLFSVRTGPFNDTLEAGQAARRIRESSSFEPMIVTR